MPVQCPGRSLTGKKKGFCPDQRTPEIRIGDRQCRYGARFAFMYVCHNATMPCHPCTMGNHNFQPFIHHPHNLQPSFWPTLVANQQTGGRTPERPRPAGFTTFFTCSKANRRPKICPKHWDQGSNPTFTILGWLQDGPRRLCGRAPCFANCEIFR